MEVNTIEIKKNDKDAAYDMSRLASLLLKHGYDVSLHNDGFCYVINFDFNDSELGDKNLAWLTLDEYELVSEYRSEQKGNN